jgi:hypothetical protein
LSGRALQALAATAVACFWTIPLPASAQQIPIPPVTVPAPTLVIPPGPAAQLDAFARSWAAMAAYSATVTVYERKNEQVQNVVFNYDFRKPTAVTVRVVSGKDAGVTLAWNGAATVIARRGKGLIGLFKRTLSLHDPLATTIRGSSIDQLSFGAILAHAQGEAGKLSEAPGEVVDGAATDAVTLISRAPAANAGLTREVVELSPLTHLPMRVLGYAGDTLVRKVEFSNVTPVK